MKKENVVVKKQVILNAIQDLRRLSLQLVNSMRGRSRIKYGMTALFNNGGFTLIELLVVVLIIGILAAVAVPQYRKTVELNEAKMILANMYAVKKMENMYKLANGHYTFNWEELDVIPTATKISKAKNVLRAADGQEYSLVDEGTYAHVNGHDRGHQYYLYLAFSATTQICYPQGTDKGKRVCKYLGCEADKVDSTSCYFTWRP